jgi:hypothetical protein
MWGADRAVLALLLSGTLLPGTWLKQETLNQDTLNRKTRMKTCKDNGATAGTSHPADAMQGISPI